MDTQTGNVVGEIADTPGVHGIALAPALGRGFISAGKANQVVVFDLKSRNVIARIDVGAKPDAILYDPGTRKVFAFNGHSHDVSVIDAAGGKVVATIALGGAPEFARADGSGHIYVNLEDKNQLAAVDVHSLDVTARWPLPGCDGPLGSRNRRAASPQLLRVRQRHHVHSGYADRPRRGYDADRARESTARSSTRKRRMYSAPMARGL